MCFRLPGLANSHSLNLSSYNVAHLACFISSSGTRFSSPQRGELLQPFSGQITTPIKPNGSYSTDQRTIICCSRSWRSKLHLQCYFPNILVSITLTRLELEVLILNISNVGAVAKLFDISCLSGSSAFNTIQNDAFKIWNNSASSVTPQQVTKKLGHDLLVLGEHYYVPNPNITTGSPAISPKWDFTSNAEKGNAEAYVIGAKIASLPAPSSKNDIDWVQLKKVEGGLADAVYRVDTKGGQPPASVSKV